MKTARPDHDAEPEVQKRWYGRRRPGTAPAYRRLAPFPRGVVQLGAAVALTSLAPCCQPVVGGGGDGGQSDFICEDDVATSGRLAVRARGNPDEAQQAMLELINRARADPGAEASRLGIGLAEGTQPPLRDGPRPPLALSALLTQVAAAHSQDMLERDFFAHDNPEGEDPFERMAHAGYDFSVAAENLYIGLSSAPLDPDQVVAEAHDALFVDEGIAGRGHRVNLLIEDVTEIGIGIAEGTYTDQGMDWNAVTVTLDAGAPAQANHPCLLGVVCADQDGDALCEPGEGLAGVRVQARGDEVVETLTDRGGGFAFAVSEAGTFTVRFSGGGLGQASCQSVVVLDQSVKVDLYE